MVPNSMLMSLLEECYENIPWLEVIEVAQRPVASNGVTWLGDVQATYEQQHRYTKGVQHSP